MADGAGQRIRASGLGVPDNSNRRCTMSCTSLSSRAVAHHRLLQLQCVYSATGKSASTARADGRAARLSEQEGGLAG